MYAFTSQKMGLWRTWSSTLIDLRQQVDVKDHHEPAMAGVVLPHQHAARMSHSVSGQCFGGEGSKGVGTSNERYGDFKITRILLTLDRFSIYDSLDGQPC